MSNSVRSHRRQPTRLHRPWDSPGKNTGVGCHFLLQCMKVKNKSQVAQSCPTLCDPMDCSLPGSSVHGIFQARVLEWGAIAFSTKVWVYFVFWYLVLVLMVIITEKDASYLRKKWVELTKSFFNPIHWSYSDSFWNQSFLLNKLKGATFLEFLKMVSLSSIIFQLASLKTSYKITWENLSVRIWAVW